MSFTPSCRRLIPLVALLASAWAGAADDLLPNGAPIAPSTHHRTARADPPGALPPTPLHPRAAAGLARRYAGTPIDVTTFHYDGLRTGWNPGETELTPASVASQRFGLLKTLNVDGSVMAQPLLVSNFVMPDGSTHDLLIVATGHNSVYAFDAQSYGLLWQVNLGPSQSASDVGCGDIDPEYGIGSTPVIVRSGPDAGTLYVVSATEPTPFSFHTHLHALNLGTGADVKAPVEINPSARLSDGSTMRFKAQYQWSRASLVAANGAIYVSIGSHCDISANSISGWVLRYGTDLTPGPAFNTLETPAGYELASIWGAGFGPAVDTAGNLFAITGNGNYSRGGRDWGESVIKLPPNLRRVSSFFTPSAYTQLNNADLDFGSGGVMLLPQQSDPNTPPLAVAMGKDAVLYLLDRDNLGRSRKNDAGALQATRVKSSGSGVWGGPAYYAGPNGPVVFYQVNSDVLRAYNVNGGANPTLTPRNQGTSTAGYGGSMPVVSSNGAAANSAVVWLVRRGNTVQLEAYDANLLGAPIYAAAAGTWSTNFGNSFVSAQQANGRVYVPAYKTVTVFGLTP